MKIIVKILVCLVIYSMQGMTRRGASPLQEVVIFTEDPVVRAYLSGFRSQGNRRCVLTIGKFFDTSFLYMYALYDDGTFGPCYVDDTVARARQEFLRGRCP
jgi:hypothetical protein